MPSLHVRRAHPDETPWINRQSAEIGFLPSDPSRELIAIAEWQDARAGLGRVVSFGDSAELGGMYVLEPFRGRGAAEAIVRFLLEHRDPTRTLYCLPFAHLEGFYRKLGFSPCENPD